MMLRKVFGWAGLVLALFIGTFGMHVCILVLLGLLMFLLGFTSMCYISKAPAAEAKKIFYLSSHFSYCSRGLNKVIDKMKNPKCQIKFDRRLTGANVIDEQIQEVLTFAFRDFIQPWYFQISTDEEFLARVRDSVQKVIINIAIKAKDVEWVPYLTSRLVNDFAHHLHLYRQAQSKLKQIRDVDTYNTISHQTLFFSLEMATENDLSREKICTSKEKEKEYLQDLTEILSYLLLPSEDFSNKLLRYLIREIIISLAIEPLINLLSDPDYINQIIIWLCREAPLTSEGFLLVIKSTDNSEELLAVREIVTHEIAVQRSKDTGGEDDTEIKQQLSSLLYVQKVVDIRLQRLQEGNVETDSTGLPTELDWQKYSDPSMKLVNLPFDIVLTNNIALYYFTEFMTNLSAQGYVYFYHAIEGYKVSAEQLLSQMHLAQDNPPDLETLRDAAQHIYELYLSEKASLKVKIEETLMKRLSQKLSLEVPSEMWFDEVQSKIFEIMQEEPYYINFKKSKGYIKLLEELDLLREFSSKSEEDIQSGSKEGPGLTKEASSSKFCVDDSLSLSGFDSLSVSSSEHEEEILGSCQELALEDMSLNANIVNTGITTHGNKTFAIYAITVIRKDTDDKWCVVRRYSDFHNFYVSLVDKFTNFSSIPFPGKKTFNNLSPQFLEKRSKQLNEFLQQILSAEVLAANPGLHLAVYKFLEPKMYEKEKRQFSKAMGTLVNPLKTSVKNVSHMVRAVPDSLMDSLGKVLGTKVTASPLQQKIDLEGEDNIPLRILLLLMDEVFDLKSKDQWFRRRIVILLRQIIKATFGDTINRKIVDYVEIMTSPLQVAEYVKKVRQALWPNGSLAMPSKTRDLNTQMRTRVAAKMLMLCSIPDELKRVIGSSTTRRGVLCVFEMFQHPILNRRLMYVLLEGGLETLFPQNRFPQIFRKLHQRAHQTASSKSLLDFAQFR